MPKLDEFTIPENETELAEFMNDSKKVLAALKAGKFPELVNSAAQVHLKKDGELQAQFNEQLQMGLANFARENGLGTGRKVKFETVDGFRKQYITNKNKGQGYKKGCTASQLDHVFESPADFFRMSLVQRELAQAPDAARLRGLLDKYNTTISNAASSVVPSDGGFLIPEILRSEIMTLMLEDAVVRPNATVIPMDSLKVPIPAVDETSRVSSIYGGIAFTWTPESGAGVDSSAKFGQVVLDAKKLFGYAGIPNELINDSAAFNAWFGQKFPQAAGYFEDDGFMNGTGNEQPLGVLQGNGLISINRVSTSSVTAVEYRDFVNLYTRMYPASRKRAVWVVSVDAFPALMEMSFIPTGGTVPVPVLLWNPNAIATPDFTLFGRPVYVSEKAPAYGNAGDISFIDFSEYLIGDRQEMRLDSSPHYLFGTDKMAFRVIERVDGRPWLQSAITPRNNSSNTLSPYVTLSASHS